VSGPQAGEDHSDDMTAGSEAVAIVGLGASGMAATRLALSRGGGSVYVSDLRTDAQTDARATELRELGARVELGAHDVARIAQAGVVVVSPGIAPDTPVLRDLRRRGVRWISEPEYASRFYQGSLIAVTGTNGKTTTAALATHLLEAAEIPVALGGNVGAGLAPAASELALMDPPPRWYVLEVSSFQLADTVDMAPNIGVVTTLAPDHLDRYPDVESYYDDKARLFQNARSDDHWVLNGEVEAVRRLPGQAPGVRCLFAHDPGQVGVDGPAAFVRDGVLTLRWLPAAGADSEEEALVPTGRLPILGRHNVMNALAAALVARVAGAGPEAIRSGLESFPPLPHRMEPVLERDGILWVDDSKATNVEAARSAVESLARPLVVILGGRDKGEDFRPLARALRGRARLVIVYGEAGARLQVELTEAGGAGDPGAHPSVVRIEAGFDPAVHRAAIEAEAGDVVLLSPACSSFDLFSDYRERGRRFAELVREGP